MCQQPLQLEDVILIKHYHHTRNKPFQLMVRCIKRSWSLATTPFPNFKWTLGTFVSLALKICWGNLVNFDRLFDLATIPIVLTSHNVATRKNTIVDWILEMTIVSTKNNDAWYITLLAANKLLGCLGSRSGTRHLPWCNWHTIKS